MPYLISGSVTFNGVNATINFLNSGNQIDNFVTIAQGDMIYARTGTPDSYLTRLPIGTANYILISNGSTFSWGPNVSTPTSDTIFAAMATYQTYVYPVAQYALTTGAGLGANPYVTWTVGPAISAGTLHYYAQEGWNAAAGGSSTWGILYAGKYHIEAQLEVTNNDNQGYRVLDLVYSLSGTATVIASTTTQPPSDAALTFYPLRIGAQPYVAVGATFGVRAYMTGTATTAVVSTSTWPQSYLAINRVG